MSLLGSRPRCRTVLGAAARLAGLYTLIATPLLLPWVWASAAALHVSILAGYAVPLGMLFLAAFTVLAVARRAGFIVLWVLLVILWAQFLRLPDLGIEILVTFVFWSTLAIPLALLGVLGVPVAFRVPLGRWQPSAPAVLVTLWAALLIPAVAFFFLLALEFHPLRDAAVGRIAGRVAWALWAPAPVLLAVLAVAHVWTGTARVESDPRLHN